MTNRRNDDTLKRLIYARRIGSNTHKSLLSTLLLLLVASLYISIQMSEKLNLDTTLTTNLFLQNFKNDSLFFAGENQSCKINNAFCDTNRTQRITMTMLAVPHTASTTTDQILKLREKSWNVSLPLSDRGFNCPSKQHVVAISPQRKCGSISESTQTPNNQKSNTKLSAFDCVISSLKYRFKEHSNYNVVQKFTRGIVFTTLRKPDQSILSQYRNRDMFDWTYKSLYPNDNLTTIEVEPFISKAFYRHNLFVKMLSTDTRLLFRHDVNERPIVPSKEASDYENSLGKESAWLKTAIERLKSMPFFGLFHRLSESFELFGFHMCIPINTTMDPTKHDRPVSKKFDEIVKKYFVLDRLLLDAAEGIFDDLVTKMRDKKKQGILCDVGKLIRNAEDDDVQIGLMCSDNE